jgi:hypothetical protein
MLPRSREPLKRLHFCTRPVRHSLPTMSLALLLLSLFPAIGSSQTPAQTCATRDTCRAEALIAEASGDFERFHDLAWRAVQKGKPNDPELMAMLARAMALSGRPGDAIVMLSRLADMHVKVDASGNEFRVVRTLKDWPEVESKLAALNGPPVTDAAAPTPPAGAQPSSAAAPPGSAASEPSRPADPASARTDPAAETAEPKNPTREPKNPRTPEPENPSTREPKNPRTPEPENPSTREPKNPRTPEPENREPDFSFRPPGSPTTGLAYDAVSRRWLMSDRSTAGLVVVDEISHRVVPLVSGAGAGFYATLAAFRIDARRGDLWVVSSKQDGDHVESVLHKLQLVSGRPIFEVQATSLGEVRLVDVAVDQSGTVYALDAADSRILRVRPGSRTFELVTRINVSSPAAFDVADERTAFVAGGDGVSRVDLSTGRTSLLKSPQPLDGIAALDAGTGSLFVLQQSSDGERLLRCKLDKTGRSIGSITVVDSATAIGRAGDKLYYVSSPGVIKSVRERH